MEKGRKSLIVKTWERCRSMGHGKRSPTASTGAFASWRARSAEKRRVAPEGCISVYVGAEKERFVIKTELVNHPLFKMLLDEAEMEYGYANEGPLELPCEVGLFHRILWEMEQDEVTRPGCTFAKGYYNGYRLLSPSPPVIMYRVQPC